jgi:hypothetical protein
MCHHAAVVVQILFATRTLGLAESDVGLSFVALGVGTCDWYIAASRSRQMNAHAGEDGRVVINRGILEYARSDDEVAFVMAHELAHHAANHVRATGDDMSVGAVAGEIHQHQTAREQQIEHRAPALFGGEQLVAVEQHQLVRIRADQRDLPPPEAARAEHRAVAGLHTLPEADWVCQLLERGAHQGPAIFARDVIKRAFAGQASPVRIAFFGLDFMGTCRR